LLQVGEFEKRPPELKLNIVFKVQVKNKKPNRDSSARPSAKKRFEADCSNVQPQLQQYLCWQKCYFSGSL